jgi:hypothetical protein
MNTTKRKAGRPKVSKVTQNSVDWVRQTTSFRTAMRAKAPAMRLVMIIQPSCRIGSRSPIRNCSQDCPRKSPIPSIVAKNP